MRQKHYKEKQDHRIYAMVLRAENNYVFVGKTTSGRLSAVYSRHRTGKATATEGYFDQEEVPELYLLEELQCTGSEAYKHIVAWCHIFQRAGYVGINHEGTLDQAADLLPATRKIAEALQQEPLENILHKAYLFTPSEADKPPMPKSASPQQQQTTQMNLRLTKADKARFLNFCKNNALNQREGLTLLLDKTEHSTDYPHMRSILQERDKTIASLETENQKLNTQLQAWVSQGQSPKSLAEAEKLRFLVSGFGQYLHLLFPGNNGESPLPKQSYRKFTKHLPRDQKPQYPEKESFLVLALELLLWGNSLHRTLFLIGKDEAGTRRQLRCYPKSDFSGFFPLSSPYAFPGAYWLVGCRKSKDGAMDLAAAFPLEIASNPSAPPAEAIRKESLDAKLQRLQR